MASNSNTQVLICGAGPTGLVLALWLSQRGIRVRIIDKTAEPGTTSRAIVMHARTLEFYRQLGIAETVVEQGMEFAAANLWVKGRKAARVELGAMGTGLSPFPFLLIFPQDQHEKLLVDLLARRGVPVERQTELLDFQQHTDRVAARLKLPDQSEQVCEAAYLAGCDGARSRVREVLAFGFPGGTYQRLFYVADIQGTGPVMNGELNLALDNADFLGVFPMRGAGNVRLIGTVLEEAEDADKTLTWDDVSQDPIRRLGLKVEHLNWFSTYHVHHRVADHFRQGRVFLLGDAAHIHSPAGGQGMNTGIGDAVNLAWKLAEVVQGRSDAYLLDTYEPERIAFARRLVSTTDRAFMLATSPGRIARFVRMRIVPRLLPLLFQWQAVRRFMFRAISQIAITYRHSELSKGSAGKIAAGDRLPWVPGNSSADDNFAPLASLGWQVHVYGQCAAGIADICRAHNLPLHQFPWRPQTQQAGLVSGAVYVIRPDGYLAFVEPSARAAEFESYLRDLSTHSRRS